MFNLAKHICGVCLLIFPPRTRSTSQIPALTNTTCRSLCSVTLTAEEQAFIAVAITDQYSINWVLDGLPAGQYAQDRETKDLFYTIGFELGQVGSVLQPDSKTVYLNNHYDIEIHYHPRSEGKGRLVGVVVAPFSVSDNFVAEGCKTYSYDEPRKELKTGPVTYSYSVVWKEDPTPWATRWDMYLHVLDPQIHWFSLINSIVIVLMLTGMTSMILLRALHRDIAKYNAMGLVGDDGDVGEDFGWKLVHGDVFRPPRRRMILSVLVGNGVQFLCMTTVTLFFALLGFMSPSARGALSTSVLMAFFFFAGVSGYISARVYKMQQGEDWRTNVILSALLVPGVCFGILILLNFVLVSFRSSSAVPFGTLMALIALWFLVSIPLCAIGAFFGFRATVAPNPVKTNQIPRQIPDKPFFLKSLVSALIGGMLPFGAIFIELYFILNSMWFHQLYYVFGFLSLVFVVLVVTCAQISILLTYFQLCAEDYLWYVCCYWMCSMLDLSSPH
jgi:transmembrane 9 superfamily member 2/4